ncbi:unnamed protein product [Prorocentrum cordatum]|uniref:Uncharacterized protein n=1 Tax=Prorocentrum cordatum TaxID=2364126 RepID=A0ABN9SEX0_9DINO|nr:unnamed protein product [Polarella glacialis]
MPGQRCNLYLVRGARAPAANPSWELRAARRSTAPTGRVTPGPAENSSLAEERAQMLHRKSSRTGGDLPEITRPLPRSGRAVASPRGEALRAAGTAGRTEGEREGGERERERQASASSRGALPRWPSGPRRARGRGTVPPSTREKKRHRARQNVGVLGGRKRRKRRRRSRGGGGRPPRRPQIKRSAATRCRSARGHRG